MVYMASTPALCVLEVRVHLDLPFSLIPDDYVPMTIELGALAVERLVEDGADPVAVGDRWLAEGRTPVPEVPSVIVPESGNLLLNPAQAASGGVGDFSFDERLWGGARPACRLGRLHGGGFFTFIAVMSAAASS